MIQIILSVMVGIIAAAYFGYINTMNKRENKDKEIYEDKGDIISEDFVSPYTCIQFNDIENTKISGITGISIPSKVIFPYYIDVSYIFPAIDNLNLFCREERNCRLIYSNVLTRDIDYFVTLSKIEGSNKKVFENLKSKEEKKMRDFKVGDIIRGKKNNGYGMTNENMYNAKVIALKISGEMRIKVLNHKCRQEIGVEYDVMNNSELFELIKENKFYKTLPNDFSGKLTIEKGQVIEKEDKKEILDEVEKEYLRAVIKPFRGKIVSISKEGSRCYGEYINIVLAGENITFPFFKDGTMYKGMKQGKRYNLQELGL